jgi:ubiquinone/menaquinone biosynthesis C-methylase UbiE
MTKRIAASDVYSAGVGALYDEADLSCNPLRRDTLFDLAADHGVDEGSLVLDIGCANGGISRRLLARTGCRIEGVELLPFLVSMGQDENEALGVADRFTIRQGTITDIPFADNHFDFIFCHDVIGMVDDLPQALAECRRVLKPQRRMLIYASFPTDRRLDEREAREIDETQGGAAGGLSEARAEQCISENFAVVKKMVIGSQFTQHDVENDKDESEATKSLLRIARLLTWPDRYIEQYGEEKYRIVLAGSHWPLYILLGKVRPTVFIVEKGAATAAETGFRRSASQLPLS